MKLTPIRHIVLIAIASLLMPIKANAATVWNGPLINFTQATPYPNPPGDRDQLTLNVALTRAVPSGGNGGIFNAVTETSFGKFFSPADTEWAVGSLSDYATLSYTDWTSVGGGNPVHNLPGQQLVVHLISDDIYLSLLFTSLPSGSGFSYTRSTPAAANVPPTVAITSPTNGASFTAPATVSLIASASDSDGTVTNVAFFDGATFLGQTNNAPYTVTTSFAAGSHALTAVATDNGGLSTTSAVVNMSVSAANVPPSVTITNPHRQRQIRQHRLRDRPGLRQRFGWQRDERQTFQRGGVAAQFFRRTIQLLGHFNCRQLRLGTNTLTAVATDNLGATTTSAPVHVIIARYLPPITNGTVHILLQPVATNLAAPDYAISPPGDTNRLFVVEQNGLLRIIQNGVLLPTPALDITNRVQPPLVAIQPQRRTRLPRFGLSSRFQQPGQSWLSNALHLQQRIDTCWQRRRPIRCPTTATNNYKNVINEWKISSTNANVVDPDLAPGGHFLRQKRRQS